MKAYRPAWAPLTVGKLAELVIARTGSASGVRLVPYDRTYRVGYVDVLRRVPDTTRVPTLPGWRPDRSLTATVDEVIEHVRDRRTEVPTPPRSVGPG